MSTKLKAGTATSGAVVEAALDGILELQTGSTPTTALTIDTSQNVGIGDTNPAYKLTVAGTGSDHQLWVRNTGTAASDDAIILIQTASTGTTATISGFYFGDADSGSTGQLRYNHTNDSMAFYTVSAERVRIDSAGNLLIGKTASDTTNSGVWAYNSAGQGRINFIKGTESGTGGTTACVFYYSGTAIGNISCSSTATAYNTSSDYRLKENIAPMTGALDVVSALKPVTYNWKVDGSASQGFIAHELAEVVPDAVTGTKDAVDAEGNPEYQGIDTSFLVATLVAAIQELKAEVDALKGVK